MSESTRILMRIVWIVITLLVFGSAVFYLLNHQQEINKLQHRKAIELCDYGLQKVLELAFPILSVDPQGLRSIPQTPYDQGWYKVDVAVSSTDSLCTVVFTAEGRMAAHSVVQTKRVEMRKVTEAGEALWVPLL